MKTATLKFSTIVLILSSLFINLGCSDDEESCEFTLVELEPDCDPLPPNNESSNATVVTFFNYLELINSGNSRVGTIYLTQNNSSAPYGADWATHSSPVTAIHPTNWTVNDIGSIFGIALDDSENIYLASSDIYFDSGFPSNNPSRPFGAGQIFKASGPSYLAVPFVDLPNFNDPRNGIGNIAYDKKNKQLFATNLENGMIYRISMSGGILETYDPWTADSGLVDGITVQDERIWSVGVNYEEGSTKVYFPRVTTGNASRELFSITLNPDGSFPATGSEIVEISNLPGSLMIISDIAFSSTTRELLIAERGDPHNSTVHSYDRVGAGWNFNKLYYIGGNAGADGKNSAGGVDFFSKSLDNGQTNCDEYFWASGNFMSVRNGGINLVYGIEGIKYSGNNSYSAPMPTANQDTDLFIDFDGIMSTQTKGGIGDVEVFDSNDCFDLCQ